MENFKVALGEVTGHSHQFDCDITGIDVVSKDSEVGTLTAFNLKEGVEVRHEEHHTIPLVVDDYTIGIVQEYDHFLEEAREVLD
jgi:hypothetical protein